MPLPDDLSNILDRIKNNEQTDADMAALRQLLSAGDAAQEGLRQRQIALQLGEYNVNIGQGQDIQIGDRFYVKWNDETIQKLVEVIQEQSDSIPLLPRELPQEEYIRLKNLLASGRWREANNTTKIIILKAVEGEKEGWLTEEQIQNFPCLVLQVIDRLWVQYSNGRFGFSVQKRICDECEKEPQAFGKRVGWRIQNAWISASQVIYTPATAPEGHLPWGIMQVVTMENAALNTFVYGLRAVTKTVARSGWQKQLLADFMAIGGFFTGNRIDKEEFKRNLEYELSHDEPWWKGQRLEESKVRKLFSLLAVFPTQPQSLSSIVYSISLTILPESTRVGRELEISIHLKQTEARNEKDYVLQVPRTEAVGGELNILLTAPGFQFEGGNTASLPLDSYLNIETSTRQLIQTANFRLTAFRTGTATITVELYRGDTFETTLETKVQVAGFDETSFTRTRITTQPRPVPQPDFILRVQTAWNQTNSAYRFQYQLRSFRLPSLFPGETTYHSETLSSSWIEQMRGLLETTLISDALPEDGRSRLASLGQYLFQHLLPPELQTDFRNLIPRDRTFTLLILADQNASLPWELLHDGQQFLSDRFIIGRWFWELNDTRPHEFPVGAINVAHYVDVEQPELWTALLEPPGSPPPLPLPEGVLSNLDSTEAMRGLHLIRYSQSSDAANRHNAPVTLDDTNNAQDIDRQMRPAKLNLRRNRPLVSLGYVRRDRPELTTLEQTWASAFVRAGCSAFTGSLWAVDPAIEAAFISGFYNRLWTGDSLGEAFHASRQLARAVAPDSLDWLAYVLFGDPMARPYRPVEGKGYAVVEPIGREIDDLLPPGVPVRFRLSLRRTPPVWHEERVIEVAENLTFENLQAHVKTFGLQVTPDSAITMSLAPTGNYLGWFTLVAPPEMAGNSALVQVFLMDGMLPIHSLMFSLNIETEEESSA